MTLKEKSLYTLELPKVLQLLADEAVSDAAKKLCLELCPETSLAECERLQQQTSDAVYLSGMNGSPSFSGLRDITASLERAEKGGLLNQGELLAVAALLSSARQTHNYREDKKGGGTSIDQLFSMLSGNKFLEDRITSVIISEEEISDHASDELYQIRRQIRTSASKVRDVLSKITGSQSYSKMLQDNIVTQRNGRFVVPVKAEFRGSFPGMVHDVSSSGSTLFVEPGQVVELNNTLRVLEGKEKAEIERILYQLSAEVADFASSIARDYDVLCRLDFIFARAKLAYNMRAMRPDMTQKGQTVLKRARHPLIAKDSVVPIGFTIGGDTDTVIITGPNTGGKTVCIKTLGLLTLMAQCGLQIPASEESVVRIFDSVLADIGDEQSIEQSLSTFSSHMTNIVEILNSVDDGSLVLLDELGAGTDPVEGAALAVSIIEHLRAVGATVAATTHYAELKIYALETIGVENASCEFDVQTLKPTYKVIFGIPGKSNAFAIAKRLGMSDRIISSASASINSESRKFEDVITKLEEKRQILEGKVSDAEKQRRDAEAMSDKARTRLETLEGDREKLIEDAKKKAKEILDNARAVSENVISEAKRLRDKNANGGDENLSLARAAFRGQLSETEKKIALQKAQRKAMPLPRPLKIGDTVEIMAGKTRASVIGLPDKNGNVRLQAGIMKITSQISEIQLIEDAPKKKDTKTIPTMRTSIPDNFSTSLDLRGQNGDDSIMEIDRFLDNASRLNLETVMIIHGKGTGVLRQKVQAYLKSHAQVKSYRIGTYGEGDAGVTVVTLKK